MRIKREIAQSILEYVILFGVITVMAAGLLFAFYGSSEFQNKLKSYFGES
jgi:hypothetical protein